MRALVCTVFCLSLFACQRLVPGGGIPHHGPVFRTAWSLPGEPALPFAPSHASTSLQTDVRKRMVSQAEAFMRDGTRAPGYGGSDVVRMLTGIGASCPIPGTPKALVERARTLGAYRTDGAPVPGDVVLFHNQYDDNRNGEADDWYTGAAVALSARAGRTRLATRTDGPPREIRMDANGPLVHAAGDEVTNSYVRRPRRQDPPDADYLSGQLYAGHIDLQRFMDACRKDP